jgi:hypothetical protein
MSFAEITNVRVPKTVAEEANDFLRHMGLRQSEGFALWVGERKDSIFQVDETVIPEQTGHITDDGVCVTVGPDEMHRLNVWLYENKKSVIAQLHSHPGSAYHSETDDTFPIATTLGCLSLVIPDFARHPFLLSRCAVYRLGNNATWSFVPPLAVQQLITLIP